MTGVAAMTVSPWSCMIRRKTPCVLGCWGPRLSVSRPSPGSSTIPCGPNVSKIVSPSSGLKLGVRPGRRVSAISVVCPRADGASQRLSKKLIRFVNELFHRDVGEVRLIIATHGKADEVVGHQDAAQVGMSEEADAHHLEGFALHELGARPDGGERGDLWHAV